MRHRIKGKTLGRKIGPRKALFRDLALALIKNSKITTTEAKAKAARPKIERLISFSRENTLTNFRKIHAILHSREMTKKLLEEIGPRYKTRPGGYLRIIKLSQRKGDGAKQAILELV